MESKIGYILALIGGIAFLIAGIFVISLPYIGNYMLMKGWASGEPFDATGKTITLIMGIFYVVINLFIILAGFMMKNPQKVNTGGALALILGIFSFNVLAVVAGIIGIADAKK
jgi:TRAP-type mannitol/chloroaromatic compound transport system permease small subunit